MPPPRAEAGEVEVTVRARVGEGRLRAAVGLALGPTGAAVEDALKRAQQGKPKKRTHRAWRPPQVALEYEAKLTRDLERARDAARRRAQYRRSQARKGLSRT